MAEWRAERVVGRALAGRLIADQFPALAGEPLELLAEGWDNTVWRVGGRWAFRFPRRAIAVAGVEREMGPPTATCTSATCSSTRRAPRPA